MAGAYPALLKFPVFFHKIALTIQPRNNPEFEARSHAQTLSRILSKEMFVGTASEKKMFPGVFNECVFVYSKSVTASDTPAGRNRLHYSQWNQDFRMRE